LPRHLVPAYQTPEKELSERSTPLKTLNQWSSYGNLKTVAPFITIPAHFMTHLQTVHTSREMINNDELPAVIDVTSYGYYFRIFKEALKDAYFPALHIKLVIYSGRAKENARNS
jgi:hypothetical protein